MLRLVLVLLLIFKLSYISFGEEYNQEEREDDNLFLKGIVIEKNNNYLTVKVTSNYCNGIRKFQIKNPNILKRVKEKEFISFSINTSNCEENKIYTITGVIGR